jgi:hypothetical protein
MLINPRTYEDGWRYGATGRYRRWSGSTLGFDLGAGFVFGSEAAGRPFDGGTGLTFTGGISVWDLVALKTRAELLRRGGATHTDLYIGASGQSYAGATMVVLLGLAYTLAPLLD